MEVVTITEDNKGYSYVFPGQGSQSVGMGLELFHTSRAAREVFEEADDSLGFRLSRIIFEGPSRELQDTMNSQPAIMVVSIACWKAWNEILGSQSPRPVSVAGHSLGEYTSLVVAGAVSFPGRCPAGAGTWPPDARSVRGSTGWHGGDNWLG